MSGGDGVGRFAGGLVRLPEVLHTVGTVKLPLVNEEAGRRLVEEGVAAPAFAAEGGGFVVPAVAAALFLFAGTKEHRRPLEQPRRGFGAAGAAVVGLEHLQLVAFDQILASEEGSGELPGADDSPHAIGVDTQLLGCFQDVHVVVERTQRPPLS